MSAKYDKIGKNYSTMRKTDPRISEQIHAQLESARRILNIGAGTGSYEPENVDLVAVEPSAKMIAQRKPGAHPVVQGNAEELPFEDNSFSHAMTILSMHHWTDKAQAFREINRVTTDRFVALTFNPEVGTFWLTRDYLPEILMNDHKIFPTIDELRSHFDNVVSTPLPIPADCQDGFLAAYWKRPEAYLKKEVRNSISALANRTDDDPFLTRLQQDLESGAWVAKNKDLMDQESIDAGYVIISAKVRD
ncbi:MAG: class I SAM-dependent methyltransferase [Cyclobacteriaceae bacterium]